MIRKVLVSIAACVFATVVACSKSPTTPASPTSTAATDDNAGPDGSTLKASTPGTVSPTGGFQVTDPLVLTASKAVGKFGDISPSYQFQVRSGSTVVYDSGVTGGGGAGNNVTHTVPATANLNPDTDYTWRVRAVFQGQNGAWSSDGAFKSAVGAFLRNGTLRDPLTIGRTVGQPAGNVTFSAEGATLNDQESRIVYIMDTGVSSGEFSMMAKNIKSAAPGDKSKMMAIQQGFDDLTTNPYRFSIEKRGSSYPEPGATTCRIITGNSDPAAGRIFDCPRATVNFDTTHWYLWTARWGQGFARVTVNDTDNNNKVVYDQQIGTGSRLYNPQPMVATVGATVGRAGSQDASVPRITVKNVWLSVNPRPGFPTVGQQ
jgi:hypothetical protein